MASTAITAPALVNIASNFTVGPANAATGLAANGYITDSVASGGMVTVFFSGTIEGLSGLTGAPVFLSHTSPGAVTETPPAIGSGDYVQQVGVGLSDTTMSFSAAPMNGPL
jgi:hypothetical protein